MLARMETTIDRLWFSENDSSRPRRCQERKRRNRTLQPCLQRIIIAAFLCLFQPWTAIDAFGRSSHFQTRQSGHTRLWSSSLHLSSLTQPHTAPTIATLHHEEYCPAPNNDSKAIAAPVIFLHGLLGNHRNFASIARSLAGQVQRPRRMVGLDLRNHGASEWCDEPMTYQAMARDVWNFCDENDGSSMQNVVLVGHSVGGKVAQAMALLEPDRVQGLVVLDMAPVVYTKREPHWKAVCEIVDALQDVSLLEGDGSAATAATKRSVDLQLRGAVADPALRAFLLTNLDVVKNQWKVHLNCIADSLEHLAGFDVGDGDDLDRLMDDSSSASSSLQYTGDAFFVHGGQSKFVRSAHLDTIRTYFPNHMLTTVRGAGHWVHAEAPQDVTALLLRFMDR